MMETELIFRCFASGSSGNCYYLGNTRYGILIDAGISARTIQKRLKEMNLDFANIMAVLVTHDHADHIRSVGVLGEKYDIPIYATHTIHEGISRNYGVIDKLKNSQHYFYREEEWQLFDMKINTFPISHDASECLGYVIDTEGQRFMLATDCGEPNDQMEAYLRTANHIVIEANHDEQLLLNGCYPTYLKQRIISSHGHQSNFTCAELLARNYHPGMRNIFLCHLSQENNRPEIALRTVTDELLDTAGVINGEDIFVTPLARLTPSPIYNLNYDIIVPPEETPEESVQEDAEDVRDNDIDPTDYKS